MARRCFCGEFSERRLRCGDHGIKGGVGATVGDVVADGVGEEEGLLLDEADVRAEHAEVPLAHIDAIDQHGPAGHIVEAGDELDDAALPAAGCADEAEDRAGRRIDAEIPQHRSPVARVGEGGVVEGDMAAHRRRMVRRFGRDDADAAGEHLVDALGRGEREGDVVHDRADLADRVGELVEVEVERE